MLSKHAALTKEQNLKDLYCYDRSLGHYWKLRRELTNEEWLEIDKRKKNGELRISGKEERQETVCKKW